MALTSTQTEEEAFFCGDTHGVHYTGESSLVGKVLFHRSDIESRSMACCLGFGMNLYSCGGDGNPDWTVNWIGLRTGCKMKDVGTFREKDSWTLFALLQTGVHCGIRMSPGLSPGTPERMQKCSLDSLGSTDWSNLALNGPFLK